MKSSLPCNFSELGQEKNVSRRGEEKISSKKTLPFQLTSNPKLGSIPRPCSAGSFSAQLHPGNSSSTIETATSFLYLYSHYDTRNEVYWRKREFTQIITSTLAPIQEDKQGARLSTQKRIHKRECVAPQNKELPSPPTLGGVRELFFFSYSRQMGAIVSILEQSGIKRLGRKMYLCRAQRGNKAR